MAEVPVRMALPAPRAERMSLLVARLAAFVVATIGGLILFAWQLSDSAPDRDLAGPRSLTPAAAVGIIAAAVGLFCFTFRAIRPLARLIGFALVVLGLAILSQDMFGFDLGIDQALMRGDSVAAGAAQAGKLHLAPGITGSLILFGLALLYAKQGGISSAFSQILALIILAQVLIVLAGYAYGVATYYYPFPFTQMSIYGAICRLPAGARAARRFARIRHRRGHRRAVAGRRDAAPAVARHPRACRW